MNAIEFVRWLPPVGILASLFLVAWFSHVEHRRAVAQPNHRIWRRLEYVRRLLADEYE